MDKKVQFYSVIRYLKKVLIEKITYVIALSVAFQVFIGRFPIEANISKKF